MSQNIASAQASSPYCLKQVFAGIWTQIFLLEDICSHGDTLRLC